MSHTLFSNRAPACDPAGHAGGEDVGGSRQANGLNSFAELQWLHELHQGNVIVISYVIVARVCDDLLHSATLCSIKCKLVLQAAVGDPVSWIFVSVGAQNKRLPFIQGHITQLL